MLLTLSRYWKLADIPVRVVRDVVDGCEEEYSPVSREGISNSDMAENHVEKQVRNN